MELSRRKFTVGRDTGCDIAIADDSVSRLHAELTVLPDGRVLLTDNRSRNGTAVLRNGRPEPVNEAMVKPDDEVQFGDVVLRVHDLLESLGDKAPKQAARRVGEPAAPPDPAAALRAAAISAAATVRHRWRESVIAAMVVGCLTLIAIDPQSQTFHFILGIMGSIIASLIFSLVQQYWQKK